MKKLTLALIVSLSFACSDGDLDIETLDFDSVNVQNCNTATIDTRIFFKINDDEALILNLQSGLLDNVATMEVIESSIPNQSGLTYRVFDDNVSSTYFCSDFPPATPNVVEEIEAEDGQVFITTVEIDSVTFEHTIQLQGISLVNALGERITDLTINDYGTITTTID